MEFAPVLVEFVPGTRIERGAAGTTKLPIVQNGPPGTAVIFADGTRVNVPTDQIVSADDAGGAARIGFGGMRAAGFEDGLLVFYREREILPEARLSPERGRRMTLRPELVRAITVEGLLVWSAPA